MDSNIIQVFTLFMKAIFSQVRHPSHPGRGHGSLTCHMTQFERSDWLRSEIFINIMIELLSTRFMIKQFDLLAPERNFQLFWNKSFNGTQ